jgi:hypothetical protein
VAGIGKLALVLRVDHFSARVEHGQCGNPRLEGHAIFFGNIRVLFAVTGINVDDDKVLGDKGGEFGLM